MSLFDKNIETVYVLCINYTIFFLIIFINKRCDKSKRVHIQVEEISENAIKINILLILSYLCFQYRSIVGHDS